MVERQVIDFVQSNRQAMLDDLERVVNVYSGTFMPAGTTEVSRLFGELFRDLGAQVDFRSSENFGRHLIARVGPTGGKRVFVVGHLDTVFEDEDNWTFSIDGDHAYGPGVIDMKSGALAFVWALKAMQEAGTLNKEYVILLNTDEEPGSPESRTFIGEVAEGCDYALVMEPAEPGGEILRGRKGVGIFYFDVHGISAHAGQEPEKGASAIRAAADLIREVTDAAAVEPGTTINVGTVSGGSAIYAVPARCRLGVDVRVADQAEAERVEATFKEIAERHSTERITVELRGEFHRPPMTPNAPVEDLVRRYQAAAGKAGRSVSTAISGAASDGNTLAGLGFPVLDGLGPVGGRAHSSEEYMEVETYFDRTAILAIMLSEHQDTTMSARTAAAQEQEPTHDVPDESPIGHS